MYNLGQLLYKIDSKGKIREWMIDVVDKGSHASIITTAGLQDGKKVETVIDIYDGKNIGRSNETDYFTQAVSEALASAELKLRGEYRTSIEDTEHQVLRSGIRAPLLAHKYHPEGLQKSSKTLDKMGIRDQIIYVSPKLDGNRALIKITPTENRDSCEAVMYTRKGDIMPVQLESILSGVRERYKGLFVDPTTQKFPEHTKEVILDGELFSDKMTFNELNGHLKRKDKQDTEALSKIKYHLYDVMLDKGYKERYELIQGWATDYIEIVPSYEVTATDENIKEKLEQFLAEGHEGLMIRLLDKPYENKRSWQLVKYKVFESFEAKLIGLEEDARGGGLIGAFILEMPTPSVDRDGNAITTFKAGVSGFTQEEQIEITLQFVDKYLGTQATIECFGLSEYFVPRFPKVKELDRRDI